MAVEQRPDQLSPWQAQAMAVPESLDLFLGGGRGGGKSFLLAALFLRHCEQYGEHARCLVVRKSFPGLQDLEAEFRAYFGAVYGDKLRFDGQKHRFTLPSGATLQLDQLERENDFSKYQGKSFSHIAVDECGQYNSPALVDRLRSSLRAPKGIPTRFILIANPGGVGHAWIVRRYALKEQWKPYTDPATGFDFVTIASTYRDNEFIDRERYAKNLMASCATDPELGRAWLDGDWSVLRGAYFSSVIEEQRVMIEPWSALPVNDEWDTDRWTIHLAHDFGVAAPSVTYLVARSPGAEGPDGYFYPKGSVILVDEETTTSPDDLNAGLGLTVPDQADRIKSMCIKWKAHPNGVADDAIFNRTGSQAGSIADEFRQAGVSFSKAQKGSRLAGWQTMRRMLADAGSPDRPGLYVSRNCQVWWQTVPGLPRDPRKPEDVDSTSADHAADACRYAITGHQQLPDIKFQLY
ncbi:phage terminase large subunit [Marinobacter sp.]|uniref:phage terminase large subunit n=1 Tax=Marinobacter sp. TaxID=50741 RepID=UPI003A929C45